MFDINFNNTNCNDLTVNTPNSGNEFIQFISGTLTKDFTNIRNYEIEYSKNCCSNKKIKVPVRYVFTPIVTSCLELNPITFRYNIELRGINSNFISNISISSDNITYTSLTISSITGGFSYNTINTTHYLKITHVDGFIYLIEITLSPCSPLGTSTVVSTIITYPTLDSRISIINNNLSLNILFELITLPSSIYQIIICEYFITNTNVQLKSNCIQNSYWLDCNVKCSVIDKIVECEYSLISNYYDALTYSNLEACKISYEDKCKLYELFRLILDNPDCYDPWEDCNCNDEKVFKQRIKTGEIKSNGCGCS